MVRRPPFPFAALLAATAPFSAAIGQDLVPKAAPQRQPVVLTNAVLHTGTGAVILGGSLWFQDGVIRAVLASDQKPELPAGSTPLVIDLQQKHVYPGFVAACTSLGLEELGMVRQTVDVDEIGDLTPEALALTAVNPDSTALPVARCNGVLAAAVFPRGGLLPGRASVVQLDGWTNADLAVLADAGPVVAWPAPDYGGERRPRRPGRGDGESAGGDDDPATGVQKARERIDRAFAAAAEWLAARTADAAVPIDVRHFALVPALRREVPVFVLADEVEQIETAVRWAIGRKLRPVIVGGRDALACADLLRRNDVPVIVTGVHKLPKRDDAAVDEPFALPGLLAKAGVRFCLASGSDFSQERNLPYQAAAAAAHGLPPQEALAAITSRAAEILGVGDRLGSLAAGKDATLFVCDGDPLELPTKIELAFVQGRQIDLRTKQTELAKKYRERYRQLREK